MQDTHTVSFSAGGRQRVGLHSCNRRLRTLKLRILSYPGRYHGWVILGRRDILAVSTWGTEYTFCDAHHAEDISFLDAIFVHLHTPTYTRHQTVARYIVLYSTTSPFQGSIFVYQLHVSPELERMREQVVNLN